MNRHIEPTFNVEKVGYPANYNVSIKESKLIGLYIDYVNNFLTVDKFAEYYRLTNESAEFIINKGRELRNN